jgi:hypothetical protein
MGMDVSANGLQVRLKFRDLFDQFHNVVTRR